MPLHRSLKAMLKLCFSLLVLQTLTTRIGTATAADGQRRIAKPGCPNKCGNVSVPYLFGLKEGCYLNSSTSFFLNCSHNETLFFSPNSVSYGSHQFRVSNIDLYGNLYVHTPILTACNNEIITKPIITSPEFPFSFYNNFIVVGCDTFGIIATSGHSTGCSTFCINDTNFSHVSPCTGTGCCQTPYITDESAMGSMWDYTIQLRRVTNHTEIGGKEYPCSSAFLANDYPYDKFKESELNTNRNRDDLTATISWAVGNENCTEAKSKVTYACKAKNSYCLDAGNPTSYLCVCTYGYHNYIYSYNPYLKDGCPGLRTVILNYIGTYLEDCLASLLGYEHNFYLEDYLASLLDPELNFYLRMDLAGLLDPKLNFYLRMVIGMFEERILLGILFCVVYIPWRGIRKKMLKKHKEKLFRRNGGHLLQDSLPIFQGATNPIRMFTAQEMEMATYKFDEKNIIGRGGFGIVYKNIYRRLEL